MTTLSVQIEGRSLVLAPGQVLTVGRAPENTVILGDERVSRSHGTVRWADGGWTFEDHSSQGTYLEGHRVHRITIDRPLALRLAHPGSGPVLVVQPSPRDEVARPPAPAPHAPFPPSAPSSYPTPGPTPGGPGAPAVPEGQGGAGGPGVAGNRVSQVLSSVALPPRGGTGVLRIGRAPDNDIVISDDLTVSRYHAELRQLPSAVELADLRSRTGTFVDGRRISRVALRPGQFVRIGRRLFTLEGRRLVEFRDDTATLAARDLVVEVEGGRRLLDGVSFVAEPRQVIAVIGPSGAGKSTLMRALTRPSSLSGGQVLYNGQDLAGTLEDVRSRMGVLPQDDIIHPQLRTEQALAYAAALRFSSDTTAAERRQRVHQVLADLDLDAPQHARLPIERLSGGQRKRASLALELLTRPALLLCDEPTTGLDLHREREVMQLFRTLADGGRTVIVITHSVASLDLCDRVLCLAPGGKPAYFGPPDRALGYFGVTDWVQLFGLLDQPRDWRSQFLASADFEHYVARPIAAQQAVPPLGGSGRRPRRASTVSQLTTLSRRNAAVIAGNRSHALLLAAQAPLIGLLIVAALGRANLAPGGLGSSTSPRALALVLALSAVAIGLVNSCREIVRERPIYQREHAVGLSRSAYLASKVVTLGVLVLVQAALLALVVLPGQKGPPDALFVDPPVLELTLILFATGFAAVAMGLAVSALVGSDAAALVAVPVLLVAQLVLGGGFLVVDGRPVLEQVAWTTPTYWGTRALAASADVKTLEGRCEANASIDRAELDPDTRRLVVGFIGNVPCPSGWNHDRGQLGLALGGLAVVGVGYLAVAHWGLRRKDRDR